VAGKAKEYKFTFHFPNPDEYEIRWDELEKVKKRIYKILLDALYKGRI
jgi:hypothetical protein